MKKTYEFEHGKITYRLPNALDIPLLIGAMDITSVMKLNEDEDPEEYITRMSMQDRVAFEMKQKASLMKCLDEYIEKIEVNFRGQKITTWDKLKAQPAMGVPLMMIVNEVMSAMNGIDEEKKTPLRPRASSGRAKRKKTLSVEVLPPSSGGTSEKPLPTS